MYYQIGGQWFAKDTDEGELSGTVNLNLNRLPADIAESTFLCYGAVNIRTFNPSIAIPLAEDDFEISIRVMAFDKAGNAIDQTFAVSKNALGTYGSISLTGGGVESAQSVPINIKIDPNTCEPDSYSVNSRLSALCCDRVLHPYLKYGDGDHCAAIVNEGSCVAPCTWMDDECIGESSPGRVCDIDGDGVYDESCYLRNRPWPRVNMVPFVDGIPEIAAFCCGDDQDERNTRIEDYDLNQRPNVERRECGDVDLLDFLSYAEEPGKSKRIRKKEFSPCFDFRASIIPNEEDLACCADEGACVFNGQCYYDDTNAESEELDLTQYAGKDYYGDKWEIDGTVYGWAKMSCNRITNYKRLRTWSSSLEPAFYENFPTGITRGIWCPAGYSFDDTSYLCKRQPFAVDLGYDGDPLVDDKEGSSLTQFVNGEEPDGKTADETLICDVNFRVVGQPDGEMRTDSSSEIRRDYLGRPIDVTGGVSYYGDRPGTGYDQDNVFYSYQSGLGSNLFEIHTTQARYDKFAKPTDGEVATIWQKNSREKDQLAPQNNWESNSLKRFDNGCWGISEPLLENPKSHSISGREQPTSSMCPWINFENAGPKGEKFFVYREHDILDIPLE